MQFHISSPESSFRAAVQAEMDNKTKPLHSLGRLEELAIQIAMVQGTLKPRIEKPSLLVFAADHGVARTGVSPYPQSVTGAMVRNFSQGGAAINVMTRELGWDLHLINAGTLEPTPWPGVLDRRLGPGTRNMLEESAMTVPELLQALRTGAELVQKLKSEGCNTLAFGEMGIGNSSSAALLIHCLCDVPLPAAISRGAGCDDTQLQQKRLRLEEALQKHGRVTAPFEALRIFGGFELAMMAGAALAAAEERMLIVVDGLIASAAILVAIKAYPEMKPYLLFAHRSAADGHTALLEHLKMEPLLDLNMRLGEGTGAALALPLIRTAAALLCDMATFATAEVEGPVRS
ncbi:nicotinate-nucleotide--dimethylbenzimidazole phosphoribosyltransferase [Oligoflexus tunisiensis]|uniref:nicotinate-nucleotide--dimethylbenzimidazole phosphoribosyltransferase n=1 Tax=Oligoflexus tunisiensis TaxID=708132 RepID=UPI000ABACE40|nr:nicotinate-nucleotide--dimethylbenzimidazole phosphoribosyltransferase [Oligoflexus tunisiensis]